MRTFLEPQPHVLSTNENIPGCPLHLCDDDLKVLGAMEAQNEDYLAPPQYFINTLEPDGLTLRYTLDENSSVKL